MSTSRSGITTAARSPSGRTAICISPRRWRPGQRSVRERPEAVDAAGQILRIDVDHKDGRQALCDSEGQSVRRPGRRSPRDLGLWPAQRLAHGVRPQDGTSVGRRRRAGPLGRDRPDRERRQLRLEHSRRIASVRKKGAKPPAEAEAPGPDRSDLGISPRRRQIDHRRHVYRGKHLPELDGAYLYADYILARIWALRYDPRQRR